ncbi:hypothetical protein L6164_023965 [Bauhinia variegata]|uniref:Uncharacterized protein n=1 Tax=Bauhinia variegata TaxID=167791 RepID=A0ACB9LWC5_BAUVA|nr:hypothetical protein L6164_023965 [Bauhinia variegata]
MPASFAEGLLQLEELEIKGCSQLTCAFGQSTYETEDPSSNQNLNKPNSMKLQALKVLRLHSLPNLISICSESYNLVCPSMDSLELRNCPQLNMLNKLESRRLDHTITKNGIFCNLTKLYFVELDCLGTFFVGTLHLGGLEKLEEISIRRCNHLKHLIANDVEKITSYGENSWSYNSVFPKLKEITIRDCEELEYLMPISFAMGLLQLEKVDIDEASQLKYVFGPSNHKVEDQFCNQNLNEFHIIRLQALKELRLGYLPNIFSICPENYYPIWPSLDSLKLVSCPRLNIKPIKNCIIDLELRQQHHTITKELGATTISHVQNLKSVSFIQNNEVDGLFHLEGLPTDGQQIIAGLTDLLPKLREVYRGVELETVRHHIVHHCPKLSLMPSDTLALEAARDHLVLHHCQQWGVDFDKGQGIRTISDIVFDLLHFRSEEIRDENSTLEISSQLQMDPEILDTKVQAESEIELHSSKAYTNPVMHGDKAQNDDWIKSEVLTPEQKVSHIPSSNLTDGVKENERENDQKNPKSKETVIAPLLIHSEPSNKERVEDGPTLDNVTLTQAKSRSSPLPGQPQEKEDHWKGLGNDKKNKHTEENFDSLSELSTTMPEAQSKAVQSNDKSCNWGKFLTLSLFSGPQMVEESPPKKTTSHHIVPKKLDSEVRQFIEETANKSVQKSPVSVKSKEKASSIGQNRISQTKTYNREDTKVEPIINLQAFEGTDQVDLFQSMEEDDDVQASMPSTSVISANNPEMEVKSMAKALADLQISLKMPLENIASSEAEILRLENALNFLSSHSCADGAMSDGLKAAIDSLHQEFQNILSSFKQASTTILRFTLLEEKEKTIKEGLPQRKESAIALMNEIQQKEGIIEKGEESDQEDAKSKETVTAPLLMDLEQSNKGRVEEGPTFDNVTLTRAKSTSSPIPTQPQVTSTSFNWLKEKEEHCDGHRNDSKNRHHQENFNSLSELSTSMPEAQSRATQSEVKSCNWEKFLTLALFSGPQMVEESTSGKTNYLHLVPEKLPSKVGIIEEIENRSVQKSCVSAKSDVNTTSSEFTTFSAEEPPPISTPSPTSLYFSNTPSVEGDILGGFDLNASKEFFEVIKQKIEVITTSSNDTEFTTRPSPSSINIPLRSSTSLEFLDEQPMSGPKMMDQKGELEETQTHFQTSNETNRIKKTVEASDQEGPKSSNGSDEEVPISSKATNPVPSLLQGQISGSQTKTYVVEDVEELKDDDLVGLLQSMEEDSVTQAPMFLISETAATNLTLEDNSVAKALADLQVSLEVPLKDIASNDAASLRLENALNFLSCHSFEDDFVSYELKASIDSLHQEFPSIVSSFQQASATVDRFTLLEDKEKSVKEELPQRMESAVTLIGNISKTEMSMAEIQQEEASLIEQISRLQDELNNTERRKRECEARLSSLQEQKNKCIAETKEFKKEFESVKEDKSQMIADHRKAQQKLFKVNNKWSALCSQFEQNHSATRSLS